MKTFRGYQNFNETIKGSVITIGNFDGVHRGHQEIIKKLISVSSDQHLKSIVYSFKPHPQIALRPDLKVNLLVTYDEKIELLQSYGSDFFIEEPFEKSFSSLSPSDFFDKVLLGKLKCRHLIVGYDFGFGKDRAGSMELLKKFCAENDVTLEVIEPFQVSGETISSTIIRQSLLNSEIEKANHQLGYPFFYEGLIIHGDQKGRLIGVPTANIRISEGKLVLPFGVYETTACVESVEFDSVTNVGIRPTVHGQSAKEIFVETHILNFNREIYGQKIRVLFHNKIRDEKKFDSFEELKKQIFDDIAYRSR